MPMKKHSPEEIASKLLQVDAMVAHGQPIATAVKNIGSDPLLGVPRCAGRAGRRWWLHGMFTSLLIEESGVPNERVLHNLLSRNFFQNSQRVAALSSATGIPAGIC